MIKGLYASYTGMVHQQERLDALANNLANGDTVGYKKEGITSQSFDTVLAYKIKDTSEAVNLPHGIGGMNLGVKIGEGYTDFSQGSMRETGNTFDLALSDKGFFAVEFTNKAGETSTKYTRDGNFTLTRDGYLTTQEGDFVLNTKGARVKIDPLKEAFVGRDGGIYQEGDLVTTIQVTDFEDYNYLERYGENYFEPIEGAQTTDAPAAVYSGYLEMANISVVSEMVNMIAIQRAYEANQKLITTMDSTLEISANQIGKL